MENLLTYKDETFYKELVEIKEALKDIAEILRYNSRKEKEDMSAPKE